MVSWLCQQVSQSDSQTDRQTRSWRALGTRKIATRAHEGKAREGCVGANHELAGLCLCIPPSTTLNLRPPTRHPIPGRRRFLVAPGRGCEDSDGV